MKKTILIFILLLFSSCTNTYISSSKIPNKVHELANQNKDAFGLIITPNSSNSTIGHQYVLFFLPFGNIKLEFYPYDLYKKLYTEITLLGYKPINIIDQNSRNVAYPILNININDISLTAYDFLITRRLVCKMNVSATISKNNRILNTWHGITHESEIRSYGFKPQLEKVYNICLKNITNKLVKEMDFDNV